jgi:hypothetical protein
MYMHQFIWDVNKMQGQASIHMGCKQDARPGINPSTEKVVRDTGGKTRKNTNMLNSIWFYFLYNLLVFGCKLRIFVVNNANLDKSRSPLRSCSFFLLIF